MDFVDLNLKKYYYYIMLEFDAVDVICPGYMHGCNKKSSQSQLPHRP